MPAGGRDQMSLYSSNPDGTDLELYYGANSHNTGTNDSVIEFVHPHQMQDGRILALMRQYTDVDDGGNLVIINGTQLRGEHPAAARRPRAQADRRRLPATHQQGGDAPGPLARRPLQVRRAAARMAPTASW